MLTSEDHREMLAEADEMEKTANKSRTLVRELRTALSQPVFAEVETLGQLRRLVTDGDADSYAVIRDNRDVVLSLIDKGREEGQNVAQFKDTLFHLFRLTDMQVMFVRGTKEFFGSPVVTELTGMLDNSVVSAMNDILTDENSDEEDV